MLTVEELRKIKEPYELFTRDVHKNKELRNQLLRQFHPDANGGDTDYQEAVVVINRLYEEASSLLARGIWKEPGLVQFTGMDGRMHEMQYKRMDSFELGTRYVGRQSVLYLLEEEHEELANQMKEQLATIQFADESMANEFKKCLPRMLATFKTSEGTTGIVIQKETGLYTLREILTCFDGKVEARSVAWILSSLYNLLCFLKYNKIAHNGITLDNYYISPKDHYGVLLGGWWYATKEGEALYGVPEDIYNLMSPVQQREGIGTSKLDLEAVHAIGRTLLGDSSGISLMYESDIPLPLCDWVRGPAMEDAFNEYARWNDVLQKSFGGRRFYDMKLDDARIEEKLGGI